MSNPATKILEVLYRSEPADIENGYLYSILKVLPYDGTPYVDPVDEVLRNLRERGCAALTLNRIEHQLSDARRLLNG